MTDIALSVVTDPSAIRANVLALAALCAVLAIITLWPRPLKPRIMLALADGPKILPELRAITGASYARLARALDQLERSGAIEKGQPITTQTGRQTWPYQLKEHVR